MSEGGGLTAREAADILGVSLPTLYAYVSRGLIRSEPSGKSTRERRYNGADVAALRERQAQRRDPSRAAEQALHWGAPVLESGLTLIEDGRLFYRGHDVLFLATHHTLERVAALLWEGSLTERCGGFQPDRLRSEMIAAHSDPDLPLFEKLTAALIAANAADPGAYDLRPPMVVQTGERIVRLLATTAARSLAPLSIAELLSTAWCPAEAAAPALLNAALILCADHELNVSSFTARCIASAGATPYAVIIGGLAALQGVKHGGHTARVEALLREVGQPANASDAIAGRIRRGEAVPGFGHPLYPAGDPRGRLLLELATRAFPDSPSVALASAVAAAVHTLLGDHPTIDFGLVTVANVLGLARGSALILFGIGRSVGWIGHAIEQYQSNHMIRPRARYVGPRPVASYLSFAQTNGNVLGTNEGLERDE